MGKAEVLSLLRDGEYVSGEEISRALGVTRAAVWKAVQALRADGCSIDSVPNRGYCLHRPESALSDAAVHALLEGCPWPVSVLPTVDSTNTYTKAQAALGAPHGSVYVTGRQTGGRGRLGRTFVSPPGGVYLSVLLRPQREAAELLWLTAAVAVAIRRAIRDCCPADVGIKWTNDLVIGKRKVCGILTELAAEADSGMLEYAVVGIGVNCNTDTASLPEPARDVAVSLREAVGTAVDPNALAAAMVRRLHELDTQLPGALPQWLAEYAGACVTLGQDVQILRAGETRLAHAIGIDEAGGLIVRYPDGTEGVVSSGEVSVRGMYGYV